MGDESPKPMTLAEAVKLAVEQVCASGRGFEGQVMSRAAARCVGCHRAGNVIVTSATPGDGRRAYRCRLCGKRWTRGR